MQNEKKRETVAFQSKYKREYGTIKEYSDHNFKVTHLRCVKQAGIDTGKPFFTAKGEAGNDGKLSNSISRTRAKIFEYAMCNPWEYFVTLTLNPDRYNRYDLGKFNTDLSQAIRNYNKKHKVNIRYLLIPERHKDGAWHMHGFIMGLPVEHLREFGKREKLPRKILERLNEGKRVFTWDMYAERFGFADIEQIENHEAASKYITKYITEDIKQSITELNAHLYYCSKGLKGATVVHTGTLTRMLPAPDFQNDYCEIKYYPTLEGAKECFV